MAMYDAQNCNKYMNCFHNKHKFVTSGSPIKTIWKQSKTTKAATIKRNWQHHLTISILPERLGGFLFGGFQPAALPISCPDSEPLLYLSPPYPFDPCLKCCCVEVPKSYCFLGSCALWGRYKPVRGSVAYWGVLYNPCCGLVCVWPFGTKPNWLTLDEWSVGGCWVLAAMAWLVVNDVLRVSIGWALAGLIGCEDDGCSGLFLCRSNKINS